jgi:photosystem II stability/assembly factor-like uncharacterized protein
MKRRNTIIIFLVIILSYATTLPAQWISRDYGNNNIRAIQMFKDGGGYICGENGFLARLSNWGEDISNITNIPFYPSYLSDLCFLDQNNGWVVGSSGTLFKTTNGGVSWIDQTFSTTTIFACYFILEDTLEYGWVGGSNSMMYSTATGGRAWQLANSGISGSVLDIHFSNISAGYCVTSNGIYNTSDGDSWGLLPTGINTVFTGLAQTSATTAWAVGWNGNILRSESIPQNWLNVKPAGFTTNLNSVFGLSDNEAYAVGDSGRILHSVNSGQDWDVFTLGSEKLLAVYAVNEDNIWITGINGANYYSLGEVRFVSRLTPQDTLFVGEGETFDIVFSAPFNSLVNISFQSEPGALWEPVVQNHPHTSDSVPWTVPEINSSEARLRINSAIPGKNLSDVMAFAIFIDDWDPPVISDLAIPFQPSKGNDVTINATIEDLHGVSATLWYRQGGSKVYSQKSMTMNPLNPTRFLCVVDGHEVTIKGIEYYIEARDSSVNSNTGYYRNSVNPAYVEIYTDNEDFYIPASKPGSEIYRMISIPLVLESKEISQVLETADVLGPYDKRKWRLFRWDAAANQGEGDYREYKENLSETTFEPGHAFWLVSDYGQLKTGRGHSMAPVNNTILLPESGWHQVANPFQYTVPVDSIDLDPLLSGFYLYNPAGNDFDLLGQGEILEPYNGYFIRSDADNLSIVIPAIEAPAVGKTTKKSRHSLDWQIILHIRCEGTKGPVLMFGQSSRADNFFDRLDRLAVPPPSDRSINIYIPHPDWPSFKGNYRADVRSLNEDGDCWDFNVESFIDGIVELTFDLDSRMPQDAQIFLIPKDSNFPQNLKEYSHFQYFNSGTGKARRFRLIVGSEEFMNRNVALLHPEQFTLFQNHPNPFNASTTIRYGLPASSEVSLKIFNVLGEEIGVLLDNELKEEGYHIHIWNGRDKFGLRVSSGVYFYQLKIGQSSYTKKMLLIK